MEHQDNLLSVLRILFKWKKYIIYTCGAVALGAIITVLVIPVYYEATTIFYAANPDLADPGLLYGDSQMELEYYGVDEDIDRVMSIAQSSQLVNFLIDSFDLYQHYDIDLSERLASYYVKEEFESLYNVKRTKEDAIELSIEDTDKELATNMANAARAKVNEIGQRLIKQSLEKTLTTYTQSLKESEGNLRTLNDSLRIIRDSFGVYSVLTQSEMMADRRDRAEARLGKNKVRLESLKRLNRASFRDTVLLLGALVEAQEAEVKSLNEKLALFTEGLADAEVLTRLQRELSEKLAEDKDQYKEIEAVFRSDFPSIHVLEEAAIPDIKSRPKRGLIVVVSVMIAFILSVMGVIVFDTYRNVDWKEIVQGK